MKIKLMKFNDVSSYQDWLQRTVASLQLGEQLQQTVINQITQRDRLGSTQISPNTVMPHVVNSNLPESMVIVSQLLYPVQYGDVDGITTGIYILSCPKDSSIDGIVNRLADESVIDALQNHDLTNDQIMTLLS